MKGFNIKGMHTVGIYLTQLYPSMSERSEHTQKWKEILL